MNYESIFKIIEACNNLASTGESVNSIVSSLTGEDGTSQIVAAINHLDSDLKQGFNNVVAAINEDDLIHQWTPIGDSLKHMMNSCSGYLDNMMSIKKSNEMYVVKVDDQYIPFAKWAKSKDGPLTTLSTFVQSGDYGPSETSPSLVGMFRGTQTTSSALYIWQQIAKQAQQSDNAILSKYSKKTIFNLTVSFMQEIFCLLGMIYYINDGFLKLLKKLEPDTRYTSIMGYIKHHFGNTEGSRNSDINVWNMFSENLDKLRTTPLIIDPVPNQCLIDPIKQSNGRRAAFTGNDYVGPDAYLHHGDSPVFVKQEILADDNSFFGSLQLLNVAVPHQGPTCKDTVYALQGTSVTLGSNLKLSPKKTAKPTLSSYQKGWKETSSFDPDTGGYDYFWIYDEKKCFSIPGYSSNLYVNYSYAKQPDPSSNNTTVVVTGAQLVAVGNRLGLALQFGEIDASNLSNPVIKPINGGKFVKPVWSKHYIYQEYVDLRPAGPFSLNEAQQPILDPGIISNVSFMVLGNRTGLNVQMTHTLYKADFFQPDLLPAING